MNWYDFIFSHQKTYRFQRHTIFWLLWWAYFTAIYFHYQQTGLQKVGFEQWSMPLFIKSIFLLLMHLVACYSFTHFLLPRFLQRLNYLELINGLLLLAAFIIGASYQLHSRLFPLIDSALEHRPVLASPNIWWTSISAGLLSTPKVIAAATAVRLVKRWYLKQKEKEQLEREKLAADLQLLKAQIHPEFLFTSLDSIYTFALNKNTHGASNLLLKLSNLLSYMLYECDNKLVPIAMELNVIKDYLALEKARLAERLELDIAVIGDPGDRMIAPLLLLPFVENSFSHCQHEQLDTCWINLEIRLEEDELIMKLINGKHAEEEPNKHSTPGLSNVQKRLDILYPGAYQLKLTIEPEIMMTSLKLPIQYPELLKPLNLTPNYATC